MMGEDNVVEVVKVFGGWMSPFSKRVELGLKLKGIDYEYIEENLKNKSDLLLKFNPIYKKVPVLLHNGNPISESIIILEYIDEVWNSLYPFFPQHNHLYQRAQARFWANFIDDKVLSGILKAAKSKGEEREKGIEETKKSLEALEKELVEKKMKFFGGDQIGFVDIVGTVVAYWIPSIEEAFGFQILNNFPNLTKWSQHIVNHSIVKEVLPPKSKLLPYFQAVLTPNN